MLGVDADLNGNWKRLVQDIELARNYPRSSTDAESARNPVLDTLLPSLLYIEAVSLLDDAMDAWLQQKSLTLPKDYKWLNGKLKFADSKKILSNYKDLDRIRDRRNDLGHEIGKRVDWSELDNDVSIIQTELLTLGLIDQVPKYEFWAERSAAKESSNPDAICEQEYSFGLSIDGKRILGYSWIDTLWKDGF